MSDLLESLEGADAAVWSMWKLAVTDQMHPARLAILATVSRSGGASARTLVLRSVEPSSKTLLFWTNRSSEKVAEIKENPRGELLFWLPREQTQIRAMVGLSSQQGMRVNWDQIGYNSRKNYAIDPTPGNTIDDPTDAFDQIDISQYWEMSAQVMKLDIVSLQCTPHRRLISDEKGSRWVAP